MTTLRVLRTDGTTQDVHLEDDHVYELGISITDDGDQEVMVHLYDPAMQDDVVQLSARLVARLDRLVWINETV